MSHLKKIIFLFFSLYSTETLAIVDRKIRTAHHKLTLIFAIDIVRHASRTPLEDFKYLNNFPTYEKGKITHKGKESSIAFGKRLKRFYKRFT